MAQEWFAVWFNSEYYHLLYNNRNHQEAQDFITKLCAAIKLPQQSKILDLACGKGRHSRILHQLGYDVVGVDLSEHSIKEAKQFEAPRLQFAVHDMRNVLAVNYFDAVLNLFTSFGYMSTQRQNQQVVNAMLAATKAQGLIIIDFLNALKIRASIGEGVSATEQRGDIQYNINKSCTNTHVIKTIEVIDKNTIVGTFQESVQLLTLEHFQQLFGSKAELISQFGNYNLDAFDAATSDRLIMIFQKV